MSVVRICKLLLEAAEAKYGKNLLIQEVVPDIQCKFDQVLSIVESLAASNMNSEIVSLETLDIDNESEPFPINGFISEEEQGTSNSETGFETENMSDSQKTSQDWEVMTHENRKYSIDNMVKVVQFYDNCRKNKLLQTKRRYSYVKNPATISRFRKYIENHGRKMDMLQEVENYVQKQFTDARNSLFCVSQSDLRRWGIKRAREVNLDFSASRNWVHLFKSKNRIVSRKITKLTTKKAELDEPNLKHIAKEFVDSVVSTCETIPTNCIWNFDQSSFNYERSNLRTLSHKGEKGTKAAVSSMHAATHSYSVMPLISMAGKLAPKLLICLQEVKGKIGPRVAQTLTVPENIYVTSSKSGKLDKSIMRDWINIVLRPVCNCEETAILYDSWAGQRDESLYEDIPGIRCFQIPPHTTQWIQPLDNYFFRQYKIIRRRIFDRVLLDETCLDLKQRQNVLNMHSQIYNQLQAPCFAPMLQYSWFSCGYIKTGLVIL